MLAIEYKNKYRYRYIAKMKIIYYNRIIVVVNRIAIT
jgi:hypothetical protein